MKHRPVDSDDEAARKKEKKEKKKEKKEKKKEKKEKKKARKELEAVEAAMKENELREKLLSKFPASD